MRSVSGKERESKQDMLERAQSPPAEEGSNFESNYRTRSRDSSNTDHEAQKIFSEPFTNGAKVIEVSGDGNLCGLRALGASIEAQGIYRRAPSVEDLLEISKDSHYQALQTGTGRSNDNNFYIDQLGALLMLWGQKHKLDLQLGYSYSC
jgi:hypothetical protein